MAKPISERVAGRSSVRLSALLGLCFPVVLAGCFDSPEQAPRALPPGNLPAAAAPPPAAPPSVPAAPVGHDDIDNGVAPDAGTAAPATMPPPSTEDASAPAAAEAAPTPTPTPPPTPTPTPTPPTPVPAPPAMPVPPPTPQPAPPPGNTGTLVPLYTSPSDPSWRVVADAKRAHPSVPVIAVINPASGPGTAMNAAYVSGIAALKTAGVMVLGYVSTSYTKRSEAAVRADIDSYRQWYPETTGIFFDEQSNSPGGEDYYRRVAAYARSKAFTFTVGNPGSDSSPTYVGTVDLILVYENAGLPSMNTLGGWHASYDRHNFGVIPYAVPTLDPTFIAHAKATVGYVYITGDSLPNPWDTVPAYFTDLVAQLAI